MKALPVRLKFIKIVIVLAFIAGFLLSPLLWRNEGRLLPVIPPLDMIPVLPAPFDLILQLIFIIALVVWIWYPRKAIGITAVSSMVIIMAQDQMRWQPWVYIYLMMMLVLVFQPTNNKEDSNRLTLKYLQLIIAGVYFWSGFHKLNINFIEGPFAQMVMDSKLPVAFSDIRKTGYFIPFIETGTAIALLMPRFRKVGIFAAIGMHLFILFYLSQWATIPNSVVYPWNIAMILLVILIFWNIEERSLPSFTTLKTYPWSTATFALVWIFPLFNPLGYWDHYLSFSFYSNKPSQYYIAIKDTQLVKTDNRLEPYYTKMKGLEGGQVLDMNHWALTELNVPFYPELRVFQKLSNRFYKLYKGDDSILFLELHFINGAQQFDAFTYSQLQAR